MSGARGTWLRTLDGGATWQNGRVPGADSLQFRDVHGVDAQTAYLLSIGNGPQSRIYKTRDGGATWTLQFTNPDSLGFYDCFDFWDAERGVVIGDAIEGRIAVLVTSNGGTTWTRVPADRLPPAQAGEGSFAASGTCLVTRPGGHAWIVMSTPAKGRVLHTADYGRSWSFVTVPITTHEGSGPQSVSFRDERHGVVLGGGAASTPADTLAATTSDGGKTWIPRTRPPLTRGIWGGVFVPGSSPATIVAVGPNGAVYSQDDGASWASIDSLNYWSVGFASPRAGWAVGTRGRITRLSFAGAPPADSLEREQVRGPLGARIDATLAGYADSGFAGTVLVVQNRRIVLLKGYGLADTLGRVGNGPATRFEMNSMTKMFTAAAVLQLAGAGALKIDDPVERYLGAFPAGKRDATIRQLASHTSGLIVEGTQLAGESREAFLRDVKQTPRESPAGTRYRYTNAGYSLLAALVEQVSGRRYEDYLRERIFRPAGMTTAVFRHEIPAADPRFARAHVGTANPYVWGTRGAGGVWSTVGDIYRWIVAVEEGAMIPESQIDVLFAPPVPPSEEAFGWHVRPPGPGVRLQVDKGGGSADFQSQLLYFPEDRVVIVWASNDLRTRWRQTLNRTLPGLVFGPP